MAKQIALEFDARWVVVGDPYLSTEGELCT